MFFFDRNVNFNLTIVIEIVFFSNNWFFIFYFKYYNHNNKLYIEENKTNVIILSELMPSSFYRIPLHTHTTERFIYASSLMDVGVCVYAKCACVEIIIDRNCRIMLTIKFVCGVDAENINLYGFLLNI